MDAPGASEAPSRWTSSATRQATEQSTQEAVWSTRSRTSSGASSPARHGRPQTGCLEGQSPCSSRGSDLRNSSARRSAPRGRTFSLHPFGPQALPQLLETAVHQIFDALLFPAQGPCCFRNARTLEVQRDGGAAGFPQACETLANCQPDVRWSDFPSRARPQCDALSFLPPLSPQFVDGHPQLLPAVHKTLERLVLLAGVRAPPASEAQFARNPLSVRPGRTDSVFSPPAPIRPGEVPGRHPAQPPLMAPQARADVATPRSRLYWGEGKLAAYTRRPA